MGVRNILEGATGWLEQGKVSLDYLRNDKDLGMHLLNLDCFGLYASSSASKCSRGDPSTQAILCFVLK